MGKLMRRVTLIGLIAGMFWCGTCIADHHKLGEEVIRLHVVGASDAKEDQTVKLQVRDAVLECLQQGIGSSANTDEAMEYILENLDQLKAAGDRTLEKAGFHETCSVTLTEEKFPTRAYDTFSLPEGVYRSLRVVIGEGKGKNWWCVVFPELCFGATAEEFADAAEAGGFPDSLSGALAGEEQYQIRFFFLELLGKLENLLCGNKM